MICLSVGIIYFVFVLFCFSMRAENHFFFFLIIEFDFALSVCVMKTDSISALGIEFDLNPGQE